MAVAPCGAQSVPIAVSDAALQRQLEQLVERIRMLELALAEAEVRGGVPENGQPVEKRPATPTISAGRGGFAFSSADDAFQLRLRGYLQSDARVLFGSDAVLSGDTFLLRRVRPIIEGTVFKNFDFRLMPDFGEGRTVLQDAHIDLRLRTAVRIRAGKFKAPFGFERLVSATDLLFVERALPTGLAPNRDLGVMLSGDLFSERLSYFAGVFNGVPDGGSADADDRDSKDVVLRVFAQPFRTARSETLQGLGGGVAVTRGTHRGTAALPNLPAYRTSGQQIFFRYRLDGGASTPRSPTG